MRLQKLLYNSVLPTVRELTDSIDHLVIILPTLLALIANSTDDEYRSLLQPELRKVIAMTRPVQVSSIFICTGEFNLQLHSTMSKKQIAFSLSTYVRVCGCLRNQNLTAKFSVKCSTNRIKFEITMASSCKMNR